MARHNNVGKWGENLAVEYLYGKGYAIVERNWHCNKYEIDIIAMFRNRIVFVEVKTRSNKMDYPETAVDRRRANRMVKAADMYINMKKICHDVQYDIVAVSGSEHDYEILHFEDAFYPQMRTFR